MVTWLKNILDSKHTMAIPVMTHPGIEATGHTVEEAVKNGSVHYEALKYLADRYDSAACCTIMDLTVEAEAFGATVEFQCDDIPHVIGRLVKDAESVDRLEVPTLESGRLPEFLKASRLAVQNIKDRPIIAGCIGPFTLAGRLYDISEIMTDIYLEPDVIERLLNKCADFICHYCKALKEIGVDGVLMAEPAAGLLSNEDCAMWSSSYIKSIADKLQDNGFAIINHDCGNKGQCTQAMIDSGAASLHFGNAIDMERTLAECPPDMIVMGNIDPVGIMKQSTAERVKEVTLDLLNRVASHPNFVLSTGCDLPPHTPLENIDAFFEALSEYNGASPS